MLFSPYRFRQRFHALLMMLMLMLMREARDYSLMMPRGVFFRHASTDIKRERLSPEYRVS